MNNKPNDVESLSLRQGVAGDIHSGLTENQVMFRTLVAMSIPALAAVFAMGTNALYNILVALVTALICHYILKAVDLRSLRELKKVTYETPYSPLTAGMIVGLCMGELSPYYVTATVAALTMVVFKWGQEKLFYRKHINPAAGAKAVVLLLITISWFLPDSLSSGMLFYPDHLRFALFTEEGFLGAMELAEQMNFYGTENLSVTQSLIFWKRHGWIGGASGILTLASGILLAFWIKLKWRISLSYLLGMAVLAIGTGLFTGGHLFMRVAFHVFTGSVIFLAFYMATEPQTTPVTFKGQYLFGVLLAVLTMGLQMAGLFGSSFIALAIINPFASYLDRVGLREPFGEKERKYSPGQSLPSAPDTTSPVLAYDPSKCITCSRCIKACEEIQGNTILGYGSRGRNIFTTAGLGERGSSDCVGCGECLEYCPTGALREKYPVTPLRKWETNTVITTCSYCGIGCQMELYPDGREIAKVRGVDVAPNFKSLCIKGRFGHTYTDQKNRLTQPLIKRDGELEPVTWEEALKEFANKLQQYKAAEIGGLASTQNTNEENYLFQKFMRGVLQTNNIDYLSRLTHSFSTYALDKVQKGGAFTNSIADLQKADCILVTEADITETHPVIANYVKQMSIKNKAKLIVISSRKNKLVEWADVWLNPETNMEIAWINSLMNVIVNENLHDEKFIEHHTYNFPELLSLLKDYSPENVSRISSIPEKKLEEAARIFAEAEKSSVVYNMELGSQGKGFEKVISLINLILITGNLGKEGTGIYPLKDQNNDQGANDMGIVPDLLPGYQDLNNSKVRKKFESEWNTTLSTEKGLNAVEMMDHALKGKLKAMILMGDSQLLNEPHLGELDRPLNNLEFLVTITPFLNDNACLSDIVLPAATFAEKDGSFTSIERRVSRVRKAFDPPEEARQDWQILCALASRFDYQLNYEDPAEIMEEISGLLPLYENISYERLEEKSIQWLCNPKSNEGTSYLSEESFPEDGFTLIPVKYNFEASKGEDELQAAGDSFKLHSGRILFNFRTGFMDPQIEAINRFMEPAYVEINDEDAQKLEVESEDQIKVITHFGEIDLEVRINNRMRSGEVFIPFQFLPFHYDMTEINLPGEEKGKTQIPGFRLRNCRLEKKFS